MLSTGGSGTVSVLPLLHCVGLCTNLHCAHSRARTAGEAIEAGIARLNAGEAQAAVALFQAALELPGNGAFRMSGTVREYRRARRLIVYSRHGLA